jgi:multidrug efflux pump subunit AcrA (membrane-fusion protein)
MNFFEKRSLALALTLICLACLNLSCSSSDLPKEAQTPTEKSHAWESAEVIRQDFTPQIQARGLIKSSVGSEVRVGSRVSGIVQKLNVKIGDTVIKSQLLAELEPTELFARLNQAEATLNNARAQLEYARLDVERKRTLFKENLVSQNKLDRSERTHDADFLFCLYGLRGISTQTDCQSGGPE